MKIYVASSWKNKYYSEVIRNLRLEGFDCYDFRNPEPGNHGFNWSQVGIINDYEHYTKALKHPIAEEGFKLDSDAMKQCNVCILILPSGRSAHLEAGYFVGANKNLIIYIPEYDTPELMYMMSNLITDSLNDVIK